MVYILLNSTICESCVHYHHSGNQGTAYALPDVQRIILGPKSKLGDGHTWMAVWCQGTSMDSADLWKSCPMWFGGPAHIHTPLLDLSLHHKSYSRVIHLWQLFSDTLDKWHDSNRKSIPNKQCLISSRYFSIHENNGFESHCLSPERFMDAEGACGIEYVRPVFEIELVTRFLSASFSSSSRRTSKSTISSSSSPLVSTPTSFSSFIQYKRLISSFNEYLPVTVGVTFVFAFAVEPRAGRKSRIFWLDAVRLGRLHYK